MKKWQTIRSLVALMSLSLGASACGQIEEAGDLVRQGLSEIPPLRKAHSLEADEVALPGCDADPIAASPCSVTESTAGLPPF